MPFHESFLAVYILQESDDIKKAHNLGSLVLHVYTNQWLFTPRPQLWTIYRLTDYLGGGVRVEAEKQLLKDFMLSIIRKTV